MSNLEKQILSKIESEKISRTPSWIFKLKNIGFWSVFLATTIIGALSIDIILFSYSSTDFDFLDHNSHSKIQHTISLLPYFWIVGVGLFTYLSSVILRHTEKGYKISFVIACGTSLLISLILGISMHLMGYSKSISELSEGIKGCVISSCGCINHSECRKK
jgi:hypothetical protein